MNRGLSDRIRARALADYVQPALQAGKTQFSIAVRDLLSAGFPSRNTPQVCSALQAAKFLREHNLEIERVDGPPKKQGPTVVIHYRVAATPASLQVEAECNPASAPVAETPEEWALRLTERLRGLLKEELAEYGGGEAFIRWVRSDEPEKSNEAAA